MDTQIKKCIVCENEFPATSDFFYKAKNNKYGVSSYCKKCESVISKSWSKNNREKHQAARKRFNDARTKEERSEYHQKVRLAVLCAYSGDHPKCASCGESENKFLALDHINGGGGKHRKAVNHNIFHSLKAKGFPPGFQVLCHNCNFRKQYRKEYEGKWPSQVAWAAKTRDAALSHYGVDGKAVCRCCGLDDPIVMTIDHVNGVPDEHRGTKLRGGTALYLWLRQNDWPDGFQTLCMNCNFAKGRYGKCPHRGEHA